MMKRYRIRRGSVLVLVVALLVLMAIIGTAYISTARTDRGAAALNGFNTEIDMLVGGVEDITQIAIEQDVTDNFWSATATPTDLTSPAQQTFLASRTPVLVNAPNVPPNSPGWLYISAAPISGAVFESPYNPAGTAAAPVMLQYGQDRQNMAPTSIAVTDPSGATVQYPALIDSTTGGTYLAASASGDGIADSALFRLPMSEINGVTYYAAVRILDNNSAVDASVAWADNNNNPSLPVTPPNIYGNFTPVNVNLLGLVADGQAGIKALNLYRCPGINPSITPTPIDDNGIARGDFAFISPYDALWMQLGRRIGNPGYISQGVKYQPLPLTECGTLAYHFCLPNPLSSPSILEQAFPMALRSANMPTAPYQPSQSSLWYKQMFDYDGSYSGTASVARRALITARDGVSMFTPNKFTSQGTYPPTAPPTATSPVNYSFGDMVQVAGSPFYYVCIQPFSLTAPPTNPDPYAPTLSNDNTYWAAEPWTDHITKTPINTATFDQLWLAYWNVMTDNQGNVPGADQTTLDRNPIRNPDETVPNQGGNTVAGSISPSGGDDTQNIQNVINSTPPGSTVNFAPGTFHVSSTLTFKSAVTYVGAGGGSLPPALTPAEVLKLRAALAAANAMTERAGGNDVISHLVYLGPPAPGTASSSGGGGGATILQWTGAPNNFLIQSDAGDTGINIEGITFDSANVYLANNATNDNLIGDTIQNITGSGPYCFGLYVPGAFISSSVVACSVTNDTSEAMEITNPDQGSSFTDDLVTDCWNGIHITFFNGGQGTMVARNVCTGIQRNAIEIQGNPNGLTVRDNYVHAWRPQDGEDAHMGYSIATGGNGVVNGQNINIINNVVTGDGDGNMGTPPNPAVNFSSFELMGLNVSVSNNYVSNMGFAQLIDPPSGFPCTWSTTGNIWCGLTGCTNGQTVGPPVYSGAAPTANSGNQTFVNPNAVPPPHLAMNQPAPGTSQSPPTPSSTTTYSVMVYGTARNPYMTRVYADNDISLPSGGYIAIELYNPYSTPITLKNWQLATLSRPSGVVTGVPLTALTSTAAWASNPPTIPAGGFITLASSATPPPQYTGHGPSSSGLYVLSDLNSAFNNELVLLRPRRADGTLTVSTDPTNAYNEKNNVQDLVPVDSYDFTGLVAPSDPDGSVNDPNPAQEWYYARPDDPTAKDAWHFIYPGAYSIAAVGTTGAPTPRLAATQYGLLPAGLNPTVLPQGLSVFGTPNSTPTPGLTDTPIQLTNDQAPGPNPVNTSANLFPFGGFARNGDILQCPFIGAYRIQTNAVTPELVELNPVTIDSTYAKIADPGTDAITPGENIGRFTPIYPPLNALAGNANSPNDYSVNSNLWTPYHFSTQLFDYLTTNAPDDWTPNANSSTWSNPPGNPAMVTYAPDSANLPNVDPAPANPFISPPPLAPYPASPSPTPSLTMRNSTLNPTSPTDDTVPLEGLININTAPWPVLATLPMVDDPVANANLAKAIVYFRDVDDGTGSTQNPPVALHPHGPFKTIWELNEVAVNTPSIDGGTPTPPASNPTWASIASQKISFLQTLGAYTGNGYDPATTAGSNPAGDLSPQGASNRVYNDFESQNLALTRISNLITTRSDMYTVYVIVQGWRNVGTAHPSLVVQRRAAFLADRTPITPNNDQMTITNIPNN